MLDPVHTSVVAVDAAEMQKSGLEIDLLMNANGRSDSSLLSREAGRALYAAHSNSSYRCQ